MFVINDPLSIDLVGIEYRLEGLTPMQREIMSLLVQCNDSKKASAILSISVSRINNQVTNAIEHTGARDRAALIFWYSVLLYSKRHPGSFQKLIAPDQEGAPMTR